MKSPLSAARVAGLVLLLAAIFSLPVLQPAGRDLDYGSNTARFLSRFWPPDFSVLPQVLPSMIETLQMSLLATIGAALLGLPLGIAASRNTAPRVVVMGVLLVSDDLRPSAAMAALPVCTRDERRCGGRCRG